MNERHARNLLSEIARIREALDAIGKTGLSISDQVEQRDIWRLAGAAQESVRALEEMVARRHPALAPRAYAPPPEGYWPPPAPFDIRRLAVGDLQAYRALHRFALSESPHAFVESETNDAARPDSVVEAMLARGEAWGLFHHGRLVGKLVLEALPYDRLSHTRWLHAVYLHPDARGRGAGRALLETATSHARAEGVGLIALWVSAQNIPARRMYEACGFRASGKAPGGICMGGAYVDDVLMCLDLRLSPGP